MHRRDLDHSGETGRSAGQKTDNENERPDRKPNHFGGPHVAAGDPRGKAEYGVIDEDVGQNRRHNAEGKSPMNVGARNGADHVDGPDLAGRRLVEARRVPHRPFDQLIEHGKRDVDEKQT
jgi:hypothetical protein